MHPAQFYDDDVEFYDLIYADWEGSMRRQGTVIVELLEAVQRRDAPHPLQILDVAAGIGTQSLFLAAQGYDITARDISPRAIGRLSREAAARGLVIDAACADMREVDTGLKEMFDAVIAFDNAVPHLLEDDEILDAFRSWLRVLRPGGKVLCSVRDYGTVDRSQVSEHPYGERTRAGRLYRLGQKWTWTDPSHYRTVLLVEERAGEEWEPVVQAEAMYYAVSTDRLLELMGEAGLVGCHAVESTFHQPILCGRSP